MKQVRAKKHLGQHFLKDQNIARKIVDSLKGTNGYTSLLEIGPGTGVLSQFLIADKRFYTLFMDLDQESVDYLKEKYPEQEDQIIYADFLKTNIVEYFPEGFGIIGNFPYNISSQIFFKVLEWRNKVPEVVGMIQKEVADRICTGPGSKTYGILSVLLQAYYKVEYLFTVEPGVFNPPPKVRSAVIRLERNDVEQLDCDEKLFFQVVKQGFNNRRKTLRNALKSLNLSDDLKDHPLLSQRAEQLSVQEFITLTNLVNRGST